MKYLFMNEQIRKAKPSRPVIVCQEELTSDGPTQREANEFEIWAAGHFVGRIKFDRDGLEACETHEVKAWIELNDYVRVIDPTVGGTVYNEKDDGQLCGVATAKRPNEKVKLVVAPPTKKAK